MPTVEESVPIVDVDDAVGDQKGKPSRVAELLEGSLPHVIGHALIADEGHRLGDKSQRCLCSSLLESSVLHTKHTARPAAARPPHRRSPGTRHCMSKQKAQPYSMSCEDDALPLRFTT